MDTTEKSLLKETKKWLSRLEKKKCEPLGKSKEVREQVTNIRAYISDCKHFLGKKDYIRAFEAIVYAWGIWETLENLGLLKKQQRVPRN